MRRIAESARNHILTQRALNEVKREMAKKARHEKIDPDKPIPYVPVETRDPTVDPKRRARRYRDRRIATAISQIMLYLVYAPDWGRRMGDKKMRSTLRKILLDMEAAR
jgi:hypothetical protein